VFWSLAISSAAVPQVLSVHKAVYWYRPTAVVLSRKTSLSVLLWLVGMVTALRLDAGDAAALTQRAKVRGLLGRRDDAVDDYRRAVLLQTTAVYRQRQTARPQ